MTKCIKCGSYNIKQHFCEGKIPGHIHCDCCKKEGEHLHLICECGYEWIENCQDKESK